jgi:hypothetical protein
MYIIFIYIYNIYIYMYIYLCFFIYAHIFVILVLEISFFYWDNWDWCLKSSLWCFFEWWMISIQQKDFWVCFSSKNRWKLGFGTKESGHVSNVSGLYFQVFWHFFWVSFPLGWDGKWYNGELPGIRWLMRLWQWRHGVTHGHQRSIARVYPCYKL